MIILGFDIEEFDLPNEYGYPVPFEEQLSVSTKGTLLILELLKATGVEATFYCTANYADHQHEIIKKIVSDGHEIASHGYYHDHFKPEHLLQSKQLLENISGAKVSGYRMARMMPVDARKIEKAGYLYNSSINPTWLPGRYNNFRQPRTWFINQNVLQLPVSVSPVIRFPLFWLSFHHLPAFVIKWLSIQTYRKDGYLNLYFHPWEFADINDPVKYGLPSYIRKNSGEVFFKKLKNYIEWAQSKRYKFIKSGDFANSILSEIKN
jgi:peptidoglycan/xylan/chitin deacetylase (PgdA/CDA1 family)